ncbi:HAMP domain-containing histidine kinase [bacterium]|nr:HAMP domain-containing histidine kinase [bacterium]
MGKFTIKLFFIFVTFISLMFYSLVLIGNEPRERDDRHKPPHHHIEHEIDEPDDKDEEDDIPPQKPPLSDPFIVIVTLSSIFIFYILKYLEKNFISPLEHIEKNIKIIQNGSLDVKFKTKSENKTIQETYKTLNSMVTGLKQKEKLQDNFIQNLVHDLRSPVIAQERAIEILSDDMKDNPIVTGMVENNEAYLKLINSIIETLRLRDIKIDKIEIDLHQLVNTIIKALLPAANNKNIKLINNVKPNFIIWADYISINRVILNLVSNSIENIDNDKKIVISSKKLQTVTYISIKDNGAGISDEDKKNIFKKYVSKSSSGKKSVSGLGLSIVRELVLKNYGKIYIDSKVNEYTRFVVELPNKGTNNGKI